MSTSKILWTLFLVVAVGGIVALAIYIVARNQRSYNAKLRDYVKRVEDMNDDFVKTWQHLWQNLGEPERQHGHPEPERQDDLNESERQDDLKAKPESERTDDLNESERQDDLDESERQDDLDESERQDDLNESERQDDLNESDRQDDLKVKSESERTDGLNESERQDDLDESERQDDLKVKPEPESMEFESEFVIKNKSTRDDSNKENESPSRSSRRKRDGRDFYGDNDVRKRFKKQQQHYR